MKPGKIGLIVVLIALLAAGTLFLSSWLPAEEPRYSSTNAQSDGTKALYLLLQERNVPVARWRDSWEQLPHSNGHVLFLLEPDRWIYTEKDKESLLEWVESGNTLVLLSHPLDTLASQLGFSAIDGIRDASMPMEVSDEVWLQDMKELYFPRDRRLRNETELDQVWRDQNDSARIGRLTSGQGNIYYIPEPALWTNAYIEQGDNLALALYLTSLTEGEGKVWFDESLRDQRWNPSFLMDEAEEPPAYSDLIPTGAGWLLLQGVFLFILWLYLKGKRFAAPRWETVREVRRGEECVYAMGSLYQWANLNKEALAIQQRALFRETATLLGLSRRADAEEISERVSVLVDPALAERYRLLQQVVNRSVKLTGKELVKWSREIQDLREEMKQWKTKPLTRHKSQPGPNK
ncbi:DUF4350 domain-containing protein [Desmospora activa]|uniref:Uncharacterized protein DUF4350 n=1 Tax=Desmospora activa DSM 45169 TaxID=1121389 RepID=A0A2T4ZAF6_9BACL|nr:DUF4350 domain-containing protein [Desmospora activa]PTM58869.1 uncharacterized protein DUF4350 [Desmospora activa DSM 45169]